ncbi:TLD-domain-containing protein, partial [Cystobasidium minutum MCA 4210]|uniref:TLD-domain-containing protein n=1 Tax=Cystobasidium minutum MCA 4210 TaxID=1397322 RepID=UPI0034CEB1F2
LPPRIKLCKSWTLLYSLDAHGTSLTTLYTRVQAGLQKSAGGCVLVVKDMEGGIFGAYVNEAFKKSESYYGNGECFLWKVESFPPGDNFRVGPIVRAFRWTARNDYIILSDSGFLSVGGGDGKFGLWLDSSFDKGFTTSCPAFANEPLCSPSLIKTGVDGNPEGKFEIMAVECWAV